MGNQNVQTILLSLSRTSDLTSSLSQARIPPASDSSLSFIVAMFHRLLRMSGHRRPTSSLIDLSRIENRVLPDEPRPTICFDEWHIWNPIRTEGSNGAEERYDLSDTLAVGIWLNVLVRKDRDVGMTCITQSVNAISPLMTISDGIMKQTTWLSLWLFSRFMRGSTIATHVSCGTYEGEATPVWL